MSKSLVIKISVIGVTFFLVSLLWPIYQFYAYKGKVAFPPFYQFTDIPTTSPTNQVINDQRFIEAGNQALALLTEHKGLINSPAISAAVAFDGELIWAGASGWSDIENKKAVNTRTQFRIGSTSKALTGTALARIVDANMIDLDRPIVSYMPDLPNRQWSAITARQLASHTAGMPHYKENTDSLGMYQTLALSTRFEKVKSALNVFDDSQLLFEPGSAFSYSSLGTVLLSAVMEQAAAMDYLDLMQQQVFSPLKMDSTMAEFEIKDREKLAVFYWNNKGLSKQVRPWRDVDLSHRLAGGGFVSTSSDLVKMGSAFLNDDFISEETRKIFWTPQVLPDGSETPNGYALGWRVITRDLAGNIGKVTIVNHGGVSRGAQSWLMVIPEYQLSIAVNINANTKVFWDFGKVSMKLAKLFIKAKQGEINEH